ncbi:MAG: hypothetical protein V3U78_04455 [Thiotrichaceae bacterium]
MNTWTTTRPTKAGYYCVKRKKLITDDMWIHFHDDDTWIHFNKNWLNITLNIVKTWPDDVEYRIADRVEFAAFFNDQSVSVKPTYSGNLLGLVFKEG